MHANAKSLIFLPREHLGSFCPAMYLSPTARRHALQAAPLGWKHGKCYHVNFPQLYIHGIYGPKYNTATSVNTAIFFPSCLWLWFTRRAIFKCRPVRDSKEALEINVFKLSFVDDLKWSRDFSQAGVNDSPHKESGVIACADFDMRPVYRRRIC